MPRLLPLALTAVLVLPTLLPAAERPNVLVVLCDDLGYGDLGCYGHPHIRTPHLDQLAKEGLRLTDCYAAAPVCSPSRAGLLTGRTPNRLGVYDWIPPGHAMHLKTEETTIAELLKSAGYDTAQVGKWHCNGQFNSPKQPQPGDHGFDHWFATQNNASPRHENPNNFVRNGEKVGPLEGFSCQLVADEGIRWLESRKDPEKPFFLHVCFHEPHEPVESPDDLVAGYADVAKNEDKAQYFANVENLDKAVGKLVAALDRLGVAENTLVFFTSDNGPETLNRYRSANRSWGSPGKMRGMKLHIYEGGIRVAGILRWKGRIESDTSRVPVSSVDLLPTLCELAGVDLPTDKTLDGTSFAPLLDGNPFVREKPLFWHYYRAISKPRVAVRDGDWKIVAVWDAGRTRGGVSPATVKVIKEAKLVDYELYNLRDDPSETKDLVGTHPERLAAMREAVNAIYADVQAESPQLSTGSQK